jgi:SOUL heme-binding protein
MKANELHIPLKEKIKSIPEAFGIRVNEEPEYKVLRKDREFEIRHYERQLWAKITIQSFSYEEFKNEAFTRLATYIFDGKDHEPIAMTAPVLLEQVGAQAWSMSFILPEQYSLCTAPKPKDGQISIEEINSYNVAVVTYSGNNDLGKIKLHQEELKQWLKLQNDFRPEGNFITAQYDAPFVIPFLKKNEIHIKVDKVH